MWRWVGRFLLLFHCSRARCCYATKLCYTLLLYEPSLVFYAMGSVFSKITANSTHTTLLHAICRFQSYTTHSNISPFSFFFVSFLFQSETINDSRCRVLLSHLLIKKEKKIVKTHCVLIVYYNSLAGGLVKHGLK